MRCLLIAIVLMFPIPGGAENRTLHIYQDADLSNHIESSESIQKGIELAFDEIDNEIVGFKIEFKYLDHRGNVIRSKRNYQKFINDPKAIAIFSGIHSPPLIKNRDFINSEKALTLVPWAAGGPITRYPSSINWVYRLSVDDTQAGAVIIDFAVNRRGCESPHLLLEDTPWGDSNFKSMSDALYRNDIKKISVTRFGWNLKKKGAREILRNIANQGNDCVVLVANSVEGTVIVREMVNYPAERRLPIISHWGITGGDFHEVITASDREDLELDFIQTCFAFTSAHQSDFSKKVFNRLKKYTSGDIDHPNKLNSATGFIHAYDLTKILIQAIRQTGLTGDMNIDRNAIRLALENIREPVEGLVKNYHSPFSVFSEKTNYNAHEALNADDYCIGRFGPDNEVILLQGKSDE